MKLIAITQLYQSKTEINFLKVFIHFRTERPNRVLVQGGLNSPDGKEGFLKWYVRGDVTLASNNDNIRIEHHSVEKGKVSTLVTNHLFESSKTCQFNFAIDVEDQSLTDDERFLFSI